MHIYAFGSICRGEISFGSDVDLLAVVPKYDSRFDPDMYSIYSYRRLQVLWDKGNPFAWHLSLESKLLFASDGNDSIRNMGMPAPYQHCGDDCGKFRALFGECLRSLIAQSGSAVFDLGTVFLSIRNFATCFSLGMTEKPDFSRNSALRLGKFSLSMPSDSYSVLERARILCTRGEGVILTKNEILATVENLNRVQNWMDELLREVDQNVRIQ